MKSTNLIPTDKDVISCFSLSKSTISNEIAKRKDYNALSFVEFLEFIARAAEIRYKYRKLKPKEEEKTDIDTSMLERSFSLIDPSTRNDNPITLDPSLQRMSSILLIEGRTLAQKIEEFLDELLPLFNLKRKEVKIEIEFETDTEGEEG